MSDFDTAADVELGSRVSAEAQWEQAKRTIPEHDRQFAARQITVTKVEAVAVACGTGTQVVDDEGDLWTFGEDLRWHLNPSSSGIASGELVGLFGPLRMTLLVPVATGGA